MSKQIKQTLKPGIILKDTPSGLSLELCNLMGQPNCMDVMFRDKDGDTINSIVNLLPHQLYYHDIQEMALDDPAITSIVIQPACQEIELLIQSDD